VDIAVLRWCNSGMKQLLLIGIVALGLVGCQGSQPAEEPELSGAPRAVSGTGDINAGNTHDNRIIVVDESGEELCLVGEHASTVEAGDRVRFAGKRYTALALNGEHCMRLDITDFETLDSKPE
jgi:hypothetical protein